MHGLVRLKGGKYYDTEIFGYFCPISSADDYERYHQRIYNQYYLVLNEDKSALCRQYVFDSGIKYLDPAVLIVDDDRSRWVIDENGNGCIDFLSELPPDAIEDRLTSEQLAHCIELDASYHYEAYTLVETATDIDNLMAVSGGFHDAYIKMFEVQTDGALYVLFDGVWGCKIEIWFTGDVSYSIESRDPDYEDPDWFEATVILQDGYIYLVDDEVKKVEDIGNWNCWFKARKMKYHVIPNE